MTAARAVSEHARRLTRLYVLALAAVACLAIAGQLVVQWSLVRQRSDSTVVNVAGRQRMLSQRLVKTALALERSTADEETAESKREMASVLAEWRRADVGLHQGDAALGLPGRSSPAVQKLLDELGPHFAAMTAAADQILQSAGRPRGAVETLLAHEASFLSTMDAIAGQFEQEARERVAWLTRVEWGLLALTLGVLICEGLLVFRPAVERLHKAAGQIEASQSELEIARQAADAASAAKSQFLATISHELRNPLQAILGSVSLAAAPANGKEHVASRQHLETIETAARALLALLNDLLDLSRIEAGKLTLAPAECNVAHVAERTVAMMRPLAAERGLALELEIGDDVPAAVCSDAARIQQVLLNLLANAIKFTPSGKVAVKVAAALDKEATAQRIRFEVRDTGIGIAPAHQGTIFDAFTQLVEQRQGGAGLGLAICRRLVGLLGGSIGVESAPGRGSTFWFELPAAWQGPQGSLPAKAPATLNAPSDQTLRVLLVDDDPVNRRVLGAMLAALGHRVTLAGDAAEALTAFDAQPCEVAIIDWQLPGANGGELAAALQRRARERGRELPCICLSAALESAVRGGGGQVFAQWLTKPASREQLAVALGPLGVRRRAEQDGAPLPAQPDGMQLGERDDLRWQTVLARLGGRRDLLAQLAVAWSAEMPRTVERLQAASRDGHFADLRQASHLLAGQAGNFGDAELVQAARTLEASAEQGQTNESLVADVVTRSHRLAQELQIRFV